jgi:hypothetical protein
MHAEQVPDLCFAIERELVAASRTAQQAAFVDASKLPRGVVDAGRCGRRGRTHQRLSTGMGGDPWRKVQLLQSMFKAMVLLNAIRDICGRCLCS